MYVIHSYVLLFIVITVLITLLLIIIPNYNVIAVIVYKLHL